MCGISGYWDFYRKMECEKLHDTVHVMNEHIKYRGPDEEGIYLKNGLCMGMRRLSVIDLRSGSQPIFNEDGSLAVVYNGEIYNHMKLRKELVIKGHLFSTDTDTEVIVHAFEEWGTGCFDFFDGMFAFALHDIKNQKLYLVRDRMGEKPLYYMVASECFIFGSELKCLTSTGLVKKEISIKALNQFLQLSYIPSPLTIYEKVRKLMPGHFLEISENGEVKDIEYWDIPVSQPINLSYRDSIKQIRKLLAMSVKQRMMSDVPLGAFLSGGIDSASIVGLMSRFGNEPLSTFTIGSRFKEYDERNRAKEVAKLNHTVHHEKTADYDEFLLIMQKIMEKMDEPFADSSEIPTYLLSEFARNKVIVALTGDAGDELFAGYNKYLMAFWGDLYNKVPKVIKKAMLKPAVGMLKYTGSMARKVRKVIENADKNPSDQHKALMHMGIKETEMTQLMKASYYDSSSLDIIDKYWMKHPSATVLQKMLYTDLKVVLEGDMLTKVDRMSMLNSLETRIPLLSKDIVEFAMSIPDDYKLKGMQRKRILKDAMRPVLPKRFDKYPKSGFEIPIAEWMKHEMRDELEQLLSREHIQAQGIFNPEYVEKIMKEHFDGTRNRKDELWVLYIFEKWCEKEKL